VARPSQRPALGTLFLLIALAFAGIAWTAGIAHKWPIAVAAAALAAWMGTLAWQMLRRH
jgi:formate hydrogenlyase subunit 3/multisubunit Na+/H+ antiporter MnhD subunit